ncbi:DICT sensory domain-containing protein [Halothermothrix orenii]|uniref:Putative sensor protein n=1 Tax=Halothermothrix orenii (strain H 168 / OCM 544 / DSM 9562) TaxID=373903 RepID=B8CW37_HALOH|nr:DICT sensory domain-containing protein [Halothermothrix orenii]ACL69506.1 putative sensor protein [Halothermothrix orenii H 168]
MKELSLYEEIFTKLEGGVKKLDGGTDDSELNSFSLKFESRVPQLERMCYIMEQVLLRKPSRANVYAGFQKVSRARDIWDRFLKIADNVNKVYIFGEKDDDLPKHPDIDFIYLPEGHKLTREWFLVITKPIGKAMMVAYDLDGFGVHDDEKQRKFKGAKTNNPEIVTKARDLLEEVIASYND